MGSPKKQRKKYRKPLQIWQSDLIEEQKELTKEYGLKNKKEIWRTEGFLKNTRDQAKQLIAAKSDQAAKEKTQLLTKLTKLGIIKPGSQLDDILGLNLKDILNRRLQTIVFKKGLAKSVKQSRQFIVHGHISINEEKINVPSFVVPLEIENKLTFSPASIMANDQHPERAKEASRKEEKDLGKKPDETDIFVGDKSEKEVKKEVEKEIKETEKKEGTKDLKEAPKPIKKEEIQKADEVVPTENKTRENEDKSAGKEN